MKQRIVILSIMAAWVIGFMALGIQPARADSSYVSLGSRLYDDFNSSVTYTSDYCIGAFDTGLSLWGPLLSTTVPNWTVNNGAGYSCPITSPGAAIDIFTGAGTSMPNGVYYSTITIYTSFAWAGNILIFESDGHISPAYRVVASSPIQNDQSLHTNAYNKYANIIAVNRVFDQPWGLRYSSNNACPANFSLISPTVGSNCPAITEVDVSYRAAATDTPNPTHTIPPSWTPNGTTTDYPTFTPGPGDTLAPTGTLISTLALSGHSIPALITPTDYPCNVADYIYQSGNNIGTPCGTLVSFSTLALPTLAISSPTLIALQPTNTAQAITATPSITTTPTITITPSPTGTISGVVLGASPTFGIDISAVSNLATSINSSVATLMPLGQFQVMVSGTPQGIVGGAAHAGNSIGGVIVFARELQMTGFDAGGIISLALSVLVFIVAVRLFVFVAPLLLYLFKLILNVIQTILTPI